MKQQALLEIDPHVRRNLDFYETPAWMTRALLRRVTLNPGLGWNILEPCCGAGAIVRVLHQDGHRIVATNDVDKQHNANTHFDATRRWCWAEMAMPRPHIVLTNPPFNQALRIIQLALERAELAVIMLLRISWIEPTEDRGEFLAATPPTRQIVLPRWNFRGRPDVKEGGGDMVPTAWFVWAKVPWFCPPGIDVVTKREMRELIAAERLAR